MDLLKLVKQDTGHAFGLSSSTNGGEYTGPCPFCKEGDDRFHVWPQHSSGEPRYWCRICDRSGDAIQYVRELHGMDYGQALELLGISPDQAVVEHPEPARRVVPDAKPPAVEWQTAARAFIQYAQRELWKDTGVPAREYLRSERGLTDETITHFGLGYSPKEHYDDPGRWGLPGSKVYLSSGILIPCTEADTLWYVQVRRAHTPDGDATDTLLAYLDEWPRCRPEAKYMSVRGGQGKAMFGVDDLTGDGRPLLLCEGEFDAMLAWQELRDMVDVCTFGGAQKTSQAVPLRWRLRMLPYQAILVAYDVDENKAGDRAAAHFAEYSRRAVRVRVTRGGDLTGFWYAGGDLRAWLSRDLARLESRKSAA